MYQRFWDKFYDAKVSSYYFQFYAISARRKKTIVSAICLLATSALLYQMAQNSKKQWVWIALILICQLVALFQPLLPFEKQYHAACYIYEDVNQLCSEMEAYWRTIGDETSDEEINQKKIFFLKSKIRSKTDLQLPIYFLKVNVCMQKQLKTRITILGGFINERKRDKD